MAKNKYTGPSSCTFVTISVEQLKDIITESVREAMHGINAQSVVARAVFTQAGAAKFSRQRRDKVVLALKNGALKGKRYGKEGPRQRWSIFATDIQDWINRGYPTEKDEVL